MPFGYGSGCIDRIPLFKPMPMFCKLLPFLSCLLMGLLACNQAPKNSLSPTDSLASMQLMEGFEISLVAAEPLVEDPVAMEIDEQGRVYVAEMPGYPLDLSQSGKIKLLEDRDQDGVWDHSQVFAEDLTLPMGIMRWKNGILVTDAPNVLFLADTNSDGRADIREVVLTGFALSNPQHNFNSPKYGLDNWIHLANEEAITSVGFQDVLGDEGTEIFFPDHADAPRLPQNGGNRNVRFRPDTHELEMRSGNSQYGHTFDPWGHHFNTSNAAHLWHEVIGANYLNQKSELWAVKALQYTPSYGRPADVFPLTDQPEHQLLTDVGTVTSACGITWYQGGAFPAPFERVVFTGEPTHNLVHADILDPEGASFAARRLVENQEFLSSSDPWFRPVSFYVGPAGEMYVIDYYRKIIEHPEWMSDEVNQSGELYEGTRRGRIYRITAKDQSPKWETPDLSQLSSTELAGLLGHTNSWYRLHAQRMILDRQDIATTDVLTEMIQTHALPQGRVHALWTLDGLAQLSASDIQTGLKDPVAGVRENAILLAEKHLSSYPTLAASLLELENDPDARVRFQLICTLGRAGGMEYEAPLFRLLDAQGADDWSILATLTGEIGEQVARSYLFKKSNDASVPNSSKQRLATRLGEIDGMQADVKGIRTWIAAAKNGPTFMATALSGIGRGLRSAHSEAPDLDTEKPQLIAMARSQDATRRDAAMDLLEVLDISTESTPQLLVDLTQVLETQTGDPQQMADVLRLLALLDVPNGKEIFEAHLSPSQPAPVQQSAIRGLGSLSGTDMCKPLLSRWNQLTPTLRDEAIGALMKTPKRMAFLLDAVEARQVEPSTIGWPRMVHLMNHDHLPTRNRARALLAQPESSRAEVLEQFAAVAHTQGTIQEGQNVFTRLCSSCHQIQGQEGTAYGPDLASIRHRQAKSIMVDILLPQQSIADGYELWIATTQEGETVSGIIVADAGDRITLRDAAGQEHALLRSTLSALEASTYSAMTAGFGDVISQQEMADLLAYLKGWPELRAKLAVE